MANIMEDIRSDDLDSVDLNVYSDDDDLNEEEAVEFEGVGNIIVVDNLPVVPREKFEKLESVVRKIYSQIGEIRDIWMPVEEGIGTTRGYCFIEFNSFEEAEVAKEMMDGYRLDRAHTLTVNTLDEIERFMAVQEEWALPETEPCTLGENLQYWLTDEKDRDQFVIRYGSDTEVLWNDARQMKADPVYKRHFLTESFGHWSPLGTYLATVHRRSTAVWGGSSTFICLRRYTHPQVKLIDFSPGEKYLVTFSSHEPSNPRVSNRAVLNIFDVRTGKVMRNFKGKKKFGGTGGFIGVSWPLFRWGGGKEDKYFARLGKNVISVYETETFTLIDKKSIKVDNVMDFCWSPTDPIFAVFVPEQGGGNQPARVSLFRIPGKEELRQKNLFNVSDCKMYWQSEGEYLAVKVDRYTKSKKSTYTGFEVFRIKESDIPVDVFKLEKKYDKAIAFAWEPKGHRFAVIHGDNPKLDISFYSMKGGKLLKLTTLKQKQANTFFWSPSGRFIILADLKGFNGQLEFFDVDELETMATVEHFMATDIEWDPTGRYVASVAWDGFNMWSFTGKMLYRIPKDDFFQFSWRPRPPSFLIPEIEEEITKNLKKYSKRYDVQDQHISLLLKEQHRQKRKQLKEEWERWFNEWKTRHTSNVEDEYEAK